MIGPLLRSPQRGPRNTPLEPGLRRRAKNLMVDVVEWTLARFARWDRERLVVEDVTISIAGLPAAFDGYRIAFLTDMHTSPIVPRWWLESAVRIANGIGADLVALGGDFLDDDPHYIETLSPILAPLTATDGVVGVLGNHDHYVGAALVREQLVRAGVRELYNSSALIRRGDAELAVGGVGDLECDVINFDTVFAGVAPATPRIVLSHDPDVFAYWPENVRLDLMLSGHTHGGQAFLPVIGPPFIPSQFGDRFLRGRYQEKASQLYVSRGVGASGAPIRWKCPPELSVITLRPVLAS